MTAAFLARLGRRRQRFFDTWRDVGPLYAILLTFGALVPARVFEVIFATSHIQPLDDPKLACDHPEGLRWAGPEDLPAFRQFDPKAPDLEERFKGDTRVAVLEEDGQILGWCFFRPYAFEEYEWIRFELPQGGVWAFRGLILPEHRGKGVLKRIMSFAARDLSAEGFTAFFSLSFRANRSSVMAVRRSGGQPLLKMSWVRIFNFTIVRVDDDLRVGVWGKNRRFVVSLPSRAGV